MERDTSLFLLEGDIGETTKTKEYSCLGEGVSSLRISSTKDERRLWIRYCNEESMSLL